MTGTESALITAWKDPASLSAFSVAQWRQALRDAGAHNCLARLSYLIEDAGLLGACPGPARDRLLGARYFAQFVQTRIANELRWLTIVLGAAKIDYVTLKGGAYLAVGLPLARGRTMTDLDIMVRPTQLAAAERTLQDAGWVSLNLDPYDQRYYRTWMHEVPPLRHPDRGIEIDLHHRILPLTSRLRPDPEVMWERAVALKGTTGVYTLSPPDMLLHVATHLFYDGEIKGGFKDLLDLDRLIAHHGTAPDYWPQVITRAQRLELGRPLYYALRFSRALLATPVPTAVLDEVAARFGPNRLVTVAMGLLVPRVLPPQPKGTTAGSLSVWPLFIRSHWLRMPPGLLAAHLGRKTWRRLTGWRTPRP